MDRDKLLGIMWAKFEGGAGATELMTTLEENCEDFDLADQMWAEFEGGAGAVDLIRKLERTAV